MYPESSYSLENSISSFSPVREIWFPSCFLRIILSSFWSGDLREGWTNWSHTNVTGLSWLIRMTRLYALSTSFGSTLKGRSINMRVSAAVRVTPYPAAPKEQTNTFVSPFWKRSTIPCLSLTGILPVISE